MVRLLLASLALAPVALAMTVPAQAQEETQASQRLEQRAADIVAAMRGEALYDEVFADAFTSAVPEAQFLAIKGQVEAQFGALVGVASVEPVTGNAARIAIRFERGLASGQFNLQPQEPYAVTGFVISGVEPVDDSAAKLLSDMRALPGDLSVMVGKLGDPAPLLAVDPDERRAIGSTFKLYVLSALARAVQAGELAWDDVVTLQSKSFPSGQMQDWPAGAPVTLHTLATLMISTSDNTATDQLMAAVGRGRIEAELAAAGHSDPQATLPFMTTREMFLLKSGGSAAVESYRAADIDARREMLAALEGTDRDLQTIMAAFGGGPNAIDVEWLASARDIDRLMQRLVSLEDDTPLSIMGVNTSMPEAARENWDYAGFKGGSEPGVLNLSWLMRDDAGEWWVATMSWNDGQANVDTQQFELLAMRAIALAAGD